MSSSTAVADSVPASIESAPSRSRRPLLVAIGAIVVTVALVFGMRKVRYNVAHEETDNAQVEAHISPLLPRVPGYVARVLVEDNQRVTAGQPLVEIDPSELDLHISTATTGRQNAEAQLAIAEANLLNARAAEAVAEANVSTAQIVQAKAAADLTRDLPLAKTGALTDRQLTDDQAAADTASAQLNAVRRQAEAAAAQIAVAESQIAAARTQIAQRESDVAFAQLQRSYATLTAPIAGVISRKNVEPGQYIQAGQTLLSVAAESSPWIVANFKETQLLAMKAGQSVEVVADTYPNFVFHGKVESLSGATGARFALLPPDNATGNFVKVTQRVPIKIVIDQPADSSHVLRAGMSVDVAVQIKE